MARRTIRTSLRVRPRLTYEAEQWRQEVERKRIEALGRVERIPIAALIWGPSPNARSKVGKARLLLKDELLRNGHLAQFSEDLLDPKSPYSIQTQQVSHAEAHDIIISIPDSPGSIAEIHDFAKIPWLSHKIVTFLDRRWNKGYANRSLLELRSNATSDIVLYDAPQLPDCIIGRSLKLVQRLQEVYYLAGRRIL